MKRLTRQGKRRRQQIRANVAGLTAVALILGAGVVIGRCTKAAAADTSADQEPAGVSAAEIVEDTAPQAEPLAVEISAPYYPLTDADRDLVERVVMGEAGGEDYDGQRLVAQCILNACLLDGIAPDEVVEVYQYTSARPEPSESVKEAVSAVFDRHDVVTDELILFFYAPARCDSEWHESQRLVIQHGGHRFFAAEATEA